VREIVATSTGSRGNATPCLTKKPAFSAQDIYGILPKESTRVPFDIREIIARIVDGSNFHEFRSATALHCLRLRGDSRAAVGIVA